MGTYKEMVEKIQRAKTDYYQNGRSNLTDAEYDFLVSQAEKLGYIETVGAAPVDHIEKIKHEHPMLSLDKCHSIAEIKDFIKDKEVVAMYKADGLSLSATYIDGILTRLETRGDGTTGNDIMFHANSIENLPKHIDCGGKYVIDGECVILRSDFEDINSKMTESEQYSHPRNLAAGTLNLIDPSVSKKRHLRFYAWDIIEGGCGDTLFSNLHEANTLGFETVGFDKIGGEFGFEAENLQDLLDAYKENSDKKGFPIDGVVFKFNDIKYQKSLGATDHHPLCAVAYKYPDMSVPTKLKFINWQVGKSGQITPIANFDVITIDSTEVEKASVHNISIMRSLGLTNGCTCHVVKSNQIIPQIVSADDDGDGEIEIPSACPICGEPTIIRKDNNSEVLYCSNDNCPGKILGLWKTFVSKKGMDIAGISEATLERFLKLGYLTNMFVSIYELKDYKKELYQLDGFGKKSIDTMLKAIEKSKDVDLQHFICAFSIPGVGTSQSKVIAKEFGTYQAFADACDNGFYFHTLDGIGPKLNQSIHQWWMLNHMQMMDVAELINFEEDFMNQPTGKHPLLDMTFVITGKLNHYPNRDALKAEIENLGGKVAGSVSNNTNYLINNDATSTSGKNKKAKELGVKIISEEDYLKIINN